MRTNIVFTLTGPDRAGIVKEITKLFLDVGGNVETSRMARLGGEFAVLMLISIPQEKIADIDRSMQGLTKQGYRVSASPTGQTYAESHIGWQPYQIEVYGADHEGIIHEIAHTLSEFGINIESMDTVTTRAPVSGAPLFSMTALVVVPPDLPGKKWRAALEEVGNQVNVDIQVSAGTR